MLQPVPAQKHLTAITLVYGGLLLYASLMPYDFTATLNLQQLWHSAWNHWPFTLQARISGSDLLSNLLLYIPLGFLLATRSCCGYASRFRSFSLAILVCCLLSFGIELLQGLTVSRTISASDWLLNSISGLLGAAAGARYGATLWTDAGLWVVRRWQKHPLDILTLALTGLLAADNLAPFTPTIQRSQVWRSIKGSHFTLLEGFALHPWHWWLVTKLMLYALLTLLFASWNGAKGHELKWPRAILLALFLAFSLEIAKLLIASRNFNIANLACSTAGATLAVLLGPALMERLSYRRKLTLALFVLGGYLLYHAWTPFNFIWNPALLRQQLPSPIELLPFYHYAMGARLDHIRLFIQDIGLAGGFIYLLRLRCNWFETSRFKLPLAMTAAFILGIMQEGGQLFLPSRTSAMSDIYCFLIGGSLAAILNRPPIFKQHMNSQNGEGILP